MDEIPDQEDSELRDVLSGRDLVERLLVAAHFQGAHLTAENLEDAHVLRGTFSLDTLQVPFQGACVSYCYGSRKFKSFAHDQVFLEECQS